MITYFRMLLWIYVMEFNLQTVLDNIYSVDKIDLLFTFLIHQSINHNNLFSII